MDNQNTATNLQSKKWRGSLIQLLRLLGGAILGYLISFVLLIFNGTVFLPLLGMIISGQEELFELVFFYALYDSLRSMGAVHGMAEFVYTSLWALIGALLMSGRRKQIRIGVIFLILYVIVGLLAYSILVMLRVPT